MTIYNKGKQEDYVDDDDDDTEVKRDSEGKSE